MTPMISKDDVVAKLSAAIAEINTEPPPENVLPPHECISKAREHLVQSLPTSGLGVEKVITHLRQDIAPAFNGSSRSSNYYGFVTGGSTPAASLADNIATAYDQNVQVHLPKETIATEIEDKALSLLCELLELDPNQWPHRTFTTGATASNVLGLACGREYVIAEAAAVRHDPPISVGDIGIFQAMHLAGLDKFQILTTLPHSSLSKGAGLIGLGRTSIKSVALDKALHKFDLIRLKQLLQEPGTASIVAISAAEVNSGLFATSGLHEMQELRQLCDMYGAWIHVDAAFGIMGRLLQGDDYATIIRGCEGLELADSITGDGHKLLNVPYDCGFFLSRHRSIASLVFQNPNAAYLSSGGSSDSIMSPLNIGIENSRRLRALPVYATLTAYGSDGYREMLQRQIGLARGIADYIVESEDFELLPKFEGAKSDILANVYIIVLFRASDEALNKVLVDKIKETRKIYVSGIAWDGSPACRFAVSNWMADTAKDLPVIQSTLKAIVEKWKS